MKKTKSKKGEMNMRETFEKICMMTQREVKIYAAKELLKTHPKVYVGDGYVYAQGTFPVLLLAHMDTVHEKTPTIIVCDEEKGTLSSPDGIGGDDRCGIFMVLEIIKNYNCSVLFCEDEEQGGIGAKKFIDTDLAKELEFNYAIEFDRKGKNDAVFYDCENDDFEDFITKDFYSTSWGTFSDISVVAPFLKCAAVNLSCGYYNAHTTKEYVVIKEMIASMNAACKILDRTTEDDKFEYIEAKYPSYYGRFGSCYYDDGYYYGGYYGNAGAYKGFYSKQEEKEEDDDVFYYVFEYIDEYGRDEWWDTMAVSQAEAVGIFLMEHPNLCYNNIIDMMYDDGYVK